MNARKVKARVFRVIDGDPWKDLESQLLSLEMTTFIVDGATLGTSDNITAQSDTDQKQKYLDDATERIRKAVARASALGTKEKQIAQDQAVRAIEKARELQRSIVKPGVDVAYSSAAKLEKVEAAAKALVPWYLAIGAAAWIAIGVTAFVVLRKQSRTARVATRRIKRAYGVR